MSWIVMDNPIILDTGEVWWGGKIMCNSVHVFRVL